MSFQPVSYLGGDLHITDTSTNIIKPFTTFQRNGVAVQTVTVNSTGTGGVTFTKPTDIATDWNVSTSGGTITFVRGGIGQSGQELDDMLDDIEIVVGAGEDLTDLTGVEVQTVSKQLTYLTMQDLYKAVGASDEVLNDITAKNEAYLTNRAKYQQGDFDPNLVYYTMTPIYSVSPDGKAAIVSVMKRKTPEYSQLDSDQPPTNDYTGATTDFFHVQQGDDGRLQIARFATDIEALDQANPPAPNFHWVCMMGTSRALVLGDAADPTDYQVRLLTFNETRTEYTSVVVSPNGMTATNAPRLATARSDNSAVFVVGERDGGVSADLYHIKDGNVSTPVTLQWVETSPTETYPVAACAPIGPVDGDQYVITTLRGGPDRTNAGDMYQALYNGNTGEATIKQVTPNTYVPSVSPWSYASNQQPSVGSVLYSASGNQVFQCDTSAANPAWTSLYTTVVRNETNQTFDRVTPMSDDGSAFFISTVPDPEQLVPFYLDDWFSGMFKANPDDATQLTLDTNNPIVPPAMADANTNGATSSNAPREDVSVLMVTQGGLGVYGTVSALQTRNFFYGPAPTTKPPPSSSNNLPDYAWALIGAAIALVTTGLILGILSKFYRVVKR